MKKQNSSFTFVSKDRSETNLHRFLIGIIFLATVCLIMGTIMVASSSKPEISLLALRDVFSGIIFGLNAKANGFTLFPVIFNAVVFYLSVILCAIGIILFMKKGKKDRILGFINTHMGIVISLYFISLFVEYTFGKGKGSVNLFLPILFMVFVVGFLVLVVFNFIFTLNPKSENELYEKNILQEQDIFKQNLEEHPEEEENIIKMRDVRVAFKIGSIERVIINHLNLDIKRGEILGLVGESGSGKTTIGRALIRINPVSGGVITYNGVPISGKIDKKRERLLKTKMQMIFQDPGDSLNDRYFRLPSNINSVRRSRQLNGQKS